jgi:membrane protein
MRPRDFFSLIGAAASGWVEDNASRLSAALAYYSIFSLAPLLIIIIPIVGMIFGEAAARGRIADQLQHLAGARIADAIQVLVAGTSRKSPSLLATVIGLSVMLFGASGAFTELKSDLNTIWGVEIKPGRALWTLARGRFISFAMVVAAGFFLVISVIVSAAISALDTTIGGRFVLPRSVWHWADIIVSLGVMTVLFALIFKLLPNVILTWRDVWPGAACTAFLFTLGKFLIGVYLGTSSITSYYGAAGSAIVILLWVYYSACILFFGAELTKAYVKQFGGGIVPDSRAMVRGTRLEKSRSGREQIQ